MSLRDLRTWWRTRRWPCCECGLMKVAHGTAVEVAGWRHDERTCYKCDAFGNRSLW